MTKSNSKNYNKIVAITVLILTVVFASVAAISLIINQTPTEQKQPEWAEAKILFGEETNVTVTQRTNYGQYNVTYTFNYTQPLSDESIGKIFVKLEDVEWSIGASNTTYVNSNIKLVIIESTKEYAIINIPLDLTRN